MKLGMTGTQRGMTVRQCLRFEALITALNPDEFHHGDCIGADTQAKFTVANPDFGGPIETHCHPPLNPSKRSFTENDIMYPAKDYLDRNKDIVDMTDMMVALPGERTEQLRSGTWSTVRYARRRGRVIYIIYP